MAQDDEIAAFRVRRLKEAIDQTTHGDQSAFGRLLGYTDGAFVRHMLAGRRPITEKTILLIESKLPHLKGWFDDLQVPGLEDRLKHTINPTRTLDMMKRVIPAPVHRIERDTGNWPFTVPFSDYLALSVVKKDQLDSMVTAFVAGAKPV